MIEILADTLCLLADGLEAKITELLSQYSVPARCSNAAYESFLQFKCDTLQSVIKFIPSAASGLQLQLDNCTNKLVKRRLHRLLKRKTRQLRAEEEKDKLEQSLILIERDLSALGDDSFAPIDLNISSIVNRSLAHLKDTYPSSTTTLGSENILTQVGHPLEENSQLLTSLTESDSVFSPRGGEVAVQSHEVSVRKKPFKRGGLMGNLLLESLESCSKQSG